MPVIIAGFIVVFGEPDRVVGFSSPHPDVVVMQGEGWPEAGMVVQQTPGERVALFETSGELRDHLSDWLTAPSASAPGPSWHSVQLTLQTSGIAPE